MIKAYLGKLTIGLKKVKRILIAYWQRSWVNKAFVISLAIGFLCLGVMYGIAQWYKASQQSKPLVLGTTFIPAYAESLGLDPQETMDAILNDLDVKHLRLVSYWNQHEPQEGTYDFSLLDWQFAKAEKAGAKISLSIGLRQPRWPECHAPAWATSMPPEQWQLKLDSYIETVVNRYKDSPSLVSYQLENEYFLHVFGTCTDFSRDRLVKEYNAVKAIDPAHPVILSRSNNVFGFPLGEPRPDEFGISVYKRVWSMPIGRYAEYPFPAWYYGFLAGVQKIATGRDSIIHELQAEPWPPNGKNIREISLAEQNKSFNAERLEDRLELGEATGMREIYLWGSEYWYYRKVKLQDPSVWQVAREIFRYSK